MKETPKYNWGSWLWIAVSFGLTLLLYMLFWGNPLKNNPWIHLHDTYFDFPALIGFVLLFLAVTFIIYFIRSIFLGFSGKAGNLVTIISGFILILILMGAISKLDAFTKEWTLYPPLSGPGEFPQPEDNYAAVLLIRFFIAMFGIILLMLAYAAYRTGLSIRTAQKQKSS
ncbi:MAG: hypothetical protein J5I50_03705 [Chitinophagaceae bacterium]|nr:hypothetical protein [Chitinophagaceae bacterium]